MKTCTVRTAEWSCDKPYLARGLCSDHYGQEKRGVPFTALRERRRKGQSQIRDSEGRKFCVRCTQWKPESDYTRSKAAADGFQVWCRVCQREERRMVRFGLSTERFAELLEAQGHKCAICKQERAPGARDWHVDHDHACCSGFETCGLCVRGLLCGACNQMIGLAKDEPRVLESASAYLKRYRRDDP